MRLGGQTSAGSAPGSVEAGQQPGNPGLPECRPAPLPGLLHGEADGTEAGAAVTADEATLGETEEPRTQQSLRRHGRGFGFLRNFVMTVSHGGGVVKKHFPATFTL